VVDVADRPVLDTDVLIDYLRGSGPGAALLRSVRDELAYRVTAIAAFELALGRSYHGNPEPVHALLAVECLPLTRAASLRAGVLLRSLREAGQEIDVRDALQAGICLEARATLVTRNRSHYDRVPNLTVKTPDELSA
jgi:tRNA(fMet)-specific endonuclease VapC